MDFIERLRNKPLATRKRVAFIASAAVTLTIFSLWATVWHFNLAQKTPDVATTTTSASTTVADSEVNPLALFASVISSGWSGLMNNLGQINNKAQDIKKLVQGVANLSATSTATSTLVSIPVSDSIKITQ